MTPEEREFLRRICLDPGDDTARLAYADFVEERGGEARAEFIRLQVRLATLPPPHKALTNGHATQPLVMKNLGDGYYSVYAREGEDCSVGDRVDVLAHVPLKKPRWVRGLKVSRFRFQADEFAREAILRRDADSGPWPGEADLKRSKELLASREREWLSQTSLWGVRTGATVRRLREHGVGCCERFSDNMACDCLERAGDLTWTRGFVSGLAVPQGVFLDLPPRAFAEWPVEKVVIRDAVPLQTPELSPDGWVWVRGGSKNPFERHHVHHDLFDLLRVSHPPLTRHDEEDPTGFPSYPDAAGRPTRMLYLTPTRAATALSRAALRLGRLAAQLEAANAAQE